MPVPIAATPDASRKWSVRVLMRLQAWANAGWANSVVFGWGVLQATCIPGFVDVVFLPLALAHPTRAWRFALISATGTVIGSAILYWVGASLLAELSAPMARWLGVGTTDLITMHSLLDKYGWLGIFASTMSPISTKLTSVASGAFNVPWWSFAIALSAGRLTRVSLFAYLVQHGGANRVARWLKVPTQMSVT